MAAPVEDNASADLLRMGTAETGLEGGLTAARPVSTLLTAACAELSAVGGAEWVDATLTTAGDDELRRRAVEDDAAVAERCRRTAASSLKA